MPAACAPALATSDAAGEISFDCGSSWEVDLRSDAECAPSTFESTRGGESSRHRCHPRLTFGWLRNEVQLWRSGATLRAEHATAYCDLWGRGREENVLVSHAIDRPDVGERAGARRRRFHGRPAPAPPRASAAGVNVVVLILRGVGLDQARRRIPRTRSLLRRLHRSGAYQLASFGAFRALDVDGRRSLHALLHGGSGASDIWRVYRDWGYASAFGEAACSDAGARASGLGLRDEAAGAAAEPAARPDHVLLEPFCGLDAQLRAQRRPSPPARAGGSASAPQLGPAACVGQSASFEHLLNYTRAFVARAYPDVPKLVVASIPGSADRAWPADVDAPLSTALGGLLRSAPRTAVFVLSDTGPRNVATGGAGATAAFAAARPLLQLLVPSNVAPPGVMVANRRQNASMLDVHATLRELPALEHETRVAAAMHSASCRAHSCAFNASLPPPLSPHLSPPPNSPPLCAVGGCSLLRPLAPRRSCADALVPPSHCLSPSELAAAAVAANRTRSSRRRATRAAAARPRSSGAGGFGDPAAQPGGEGATNSEPTTREAMCAQRVAENRLRTSRGVAGRGAPGVTASRALAKPELDAVQRLVSRMSSCWRRWSPRQTCLRATRRDSRGFGTARCGCAARHGGGRCTRPASRRRCRRIAALRRCPTAPSSLRHTAGVPPSRRRRASALATRRSGATRRCCGGNARATRMGGCWTWPCATSRSCAYTTALGGVAGGAGVPSAARRVKCPGVIGAPIDAAASGSTCYS